MINTMKLCICTRFFEVKSKTQSPLIKTFILNVRVFIRLLIYLDWLIELDFFFLLQLKYTIVRFIGYL